MRYVILAFVGFFVFFGGFAEIFGKAVKINQGYVNITGKDQQFSSTGEYYGFEWEIKVEGNNFILDTFTAPNFNSGFQGLFQGIYDTGQNISISNYNFPFPNFVWEQAGFASYKSFSYSKIQLTPQNVLYFTPTSNQAVITATSPTSATASIPFNMTGNLILKCASPTYAPDCVAPIRRVRVYGSGTMTYTFRRWTPSDGQWAWFNIKSVSFDFEE